MITQIALGGGVFWERIFVSEITDQMLTQIANWVLASLDLNGASRSHPMHEALRLESDGDTILNSKKHHID